MIQRIKKLSKKYSREIISFRRHLHKYPELSFNEFKTSGFIFDKLTKLKPASLKIISGTGVTALIKNGESKKCVALRADIDALPIEENTNLPFASVNKGVMHACGHDAHSSILYGAALILSELKRELNGSVKFIFQPAEEKNPGGASSLIKEGILNNPKVDAIFGQHVIAGKPAGSLGFFPGVMMASQDEIYITVIGKQAHGAKPHDSIDPVVIASQIILTLQTIVSRNTSPYEPVVLTIGKVEGGTATNIIPSEVKLSGTIRTLNSGTRKKILARIEKIVKGITLSAGAKYKYEIISGYPELVNHKRETEFARNAAAEFTGKKNVFTAEKLMGAEDFAYYLKKVPGTFYRIGIGNTSDIHTPEIDLDESALEIGSGFMAYLAIKYLS
jgi:amidohydrolase